MAHMLLGLIGVNQGSGCCQQDWAVSAEYSVPSPHSPTPTSWVAVKELKLSYHNGYI